MRTQGSSRRRFATSSPRRVSSFSASSSGRRAASHSSRVPVLCVVIVAVTFLARHCTHHSGPGIVVVVFLPAISREGQGQAIEQGFQLFEQGVPSRQRRETKFAG